MVDTTLSEHTLSVLWYWAHTISSLVLSTHYQFFGTEHTLSVLWYWAHTISSLVLSTHYRSVVLKELIPWSD